MHLNDNFYTKFQIVVVHLVFLSLDKGYKPPTRRSQPLCS